MSGFKEKYFLSSLKGKVIAAFLIGAVAIAISLGITRFGFDKMLTTVNELSAPNDKLQIVNNLFYKITQLDQLQKVHALQNPDQPYAEFKKESQYLINTINTLRQLSTDNPLQVERLDSMETILLTRDTLFQNYIKLRADFVNNEDLSKRINAVSEFIANSELKIDSSIITTNTKITTTSRVPADTIKEVESRKKRQSFFNRLFGSKKVEEIPAALNNVEEELRVTIDTLFIAKQDSAIWKVEKMMRMIENEQHRRTNNLLSRELQLINTESKLHNQLLNIIHTIEAEEINQVTTNNLAATEVVNESITWINIIIIAFFLVTGILVFLIFVDISRSSKYRKQLIAAKEEAEHLGQVKQRFLANMSHEIRTPLQAIIGYAEQVRQEDHPQREALEAIYQSSEHLLHIVNEVLDYSRIVSGKYTFEYHPFDLKQLVKEVTETMRSSAEKKSLKLILLDQLNPPAHFIGDPFRLRQILFNLIGNAIKFTSKGQVTISVNGKESETKATIFFKIKDTGIGIAPEDLKKIFHVFEQADSSVLKTFGGTGLGLSIVKTLVETQGGRISVSSKPDEGSEFLVELMFKKAIPKNLPIAPKVIRPKSEFKGKVLVVDDDAFILKLSTTILNKHGIENTATMNPFTILQQEWDPSFNLVLMDIRMPDINGIELCQALRKRVDKIVKIYAVTAQALPEEREAILNQGFDGILMKPFREQELMAIIENQEIIQTSEVGEIKPAKTKPDLSIINKMVMGNEVQLKRILNQFIIETKSDRELLKEILIKNATEEAREVVHRLAGRTGQLGSKKLSSDLRRMEIALAGGQSMELLKDELFVLQKEIEDLIIDVENMNEEISVPS
ncbi:hypothetical protein BH23BAC1_BH23BAC1_20940 [soil metagenome]